MATWSSLVRDTHVCPWMSGCQVAGAPEFPSNLAVDLGKGQIIWVFRLKWLSDKMALLEVSHFFFLYLYF